jgi:hypothetical protein
LVVGKGKWKAIFIPDPHGLGDWGLFDLSMDLGQTKDLGKEEQSVFKELLVEWDRYVYEMDVDGV